MEIILYFQSLGNSLSGIIPSSEKLKNHRCDDPICDTNLWRVRHELDLARGASINYADRIVKIFCPPPPHCAKMGL